MTNARDVLMRSGAALNDLDDYYSQKAVYQTGRVYSFTLPAPASVVVVGPPAINGYIGVGNTGLESDSQDRIVAAPVSVFGTSATDTVYAVGSYGWLLNECSIVDDSTGLVPIFASSDGADREVFGLVQCANTTASGDSVGPGNLQISFVTMDGAGLPGTTSIPAGTYRFSVPLSMREIRRPDIVPRTAIQRGHARSGSVVDAKKYYKLKGDGVTDDSVAMSEALLDADANGRQLFFSDGNYLVNYRAAGIALPTVTNLTIVGETPSTTFTFDGSANIDTLTTDKERECLVSVGNGGSLRINQIKFVGFNRAVYAAAQRFNQTPIKLIELDKCKFENCAYAFCPNENFYIGGWSVSGVPRVWQINEFIMSSCRMTNMKLGGVYIYIPNMVDLLIKDSCLDGISNSYDGYKSGFLVSGNASFASTAPQTIPSGQGSSGFTFTHGLGYTPVLANLIVVGGLKSAAGISTADVTSVTSTQITVTTNVNCTANYAFQIVDMGQQPRAGRQREYQRIFDNLEVRNINRNVGSTWATQGFTGDGFGWRVSNCRAINIGWLDENPDDVEGFYFKGTGQFSNNYAINAGGVDGAMTFKGYSGDYDRMTPDGQFGDLIAEGNVIIATDGKSKQRMGFNLSGVWGLGSSKSAIAGYADSSQGDAIPVGSSSVSVLHYQPGYPNAFANGSSKIAVSSTSVVVNHYLGYIPAAGEIVIFDKTTKAGSGIASVSVGTLTATTFTVTANTAVTTTAYEFYWGNLYEIRVGDEKENSKTLSGITSCVPTAIDATKITFTADASVTTSPYEFSWAIHRTPAATILQNTSSVVVAHGRSVAPLPSEIVVSDFTVKASSAATFTKFTIDNITDTTFTVTARNSSDAAVSLTLAEWRFNWCITDDIDGSGTADPWWLGRTQIKNNIIRGVQQAIIIDSSHPKDVSIIGNEIDGLQTSAYANYRLTSGTYKWGNESVVAGIRFSLGRDILIADNIISNIGDTVNCQNAFGILATQGFRAPYNIRIRGNTVDRAIVRGTDPLGSSANFESYGLYVQSGEFTVDGLIVNGNTWRGMTYGAFIQGATGTGQIASGQSSVTITHGLGFRPDGIKIQHTTNMNDAGITSVEVRDITSTNFVVASNAATSANYDFIWSNNNHSGEYTDNYHFGSHARILTATSNITTSVDARPAMVIRGNGSAPNMCGFGQVNNGSSTVTIYHNLGYVPDIRIMDVTTKASSTITSATVGSVTARSFVVTTNANTTANYRFKWESVGTHPVAQSKPVIGARHWPFSGAFQLDMASAAIGIIPTSANNVVLRHGCTWTPRPHEIVIVPITHLGLGGIASIVCSAVNATNREFTVQCANSAGTATNPTVPIKFGWYVDLST